MSAVFGLPPQSDLVASSRRAPIGRVPTMPSGAAKDRTGDTALHVSKLAKSASGRMSSSDNRIVGKDGATKMAALPTAAHSADRLPRPTSKAPLPATLPSDAPGLHARRHHERPPPAMRTPSLVSGSSVSTYDSPMSSTLRRMPSSSIDRYVARRRADNTIARMDESNIITAGDEDLDLNDSIFGVVPPSTNHYTKRHMSRDGFELDMTSILGDGKLRARRHFTPPHDVPSSTPSTRFDSSPFSYAPTPSSTSSYSPATHAAPTVHLPTRKPSDIRPTVMVRRKGNPSGETNPAQSISSPMVQYQQTVPARKPVPAARQTASTATATRAAQSSREPQPAHDRRAGPGKQSSPRQAPPELAHLNTAVPIGVNKPLPPIRPSRTGTPSLTSLRSPSPVIVSDLPHLYTTYHKRTPSQETPVSAASPSLKSRFGFSSRSSSRQESPRVDSAISPPPSARKFSRTPVTGCTPSTIDRADRTDSPAIGPPPSPQKTPRFGFLTRKPKVVTPAPIAQPKREARKGPVAGTGHEGYARFGIRGRTASNNSIVALQLPSLERIPSSAVMPTVSRTSSQGSTASTSGLDDFLQSRLTPVILRGRGSESTVGEGHTLKGSEAASFMESSSSADSFSTLQLLPSAMDDGLNESFEARELHDAHVPANIGSDIVSIRQIGLGLHQSNSHETMVKRSIQPPTSHMARASGGADGHPQLGRSSEAIQDLGRLARPTIRAEAAIEGREGLYLRRPQSPTPAKPARKWNFFQRTQATSQTNGKEPVHSNGEHGSNAFRDAADQNIAHYAMLEPVDPIGLIDIAGIMRDNRSSGASSVSAPAPPKLVPYDGRHSDLLPPPQHTESGKDFESKARPTPSRIDTDHSLPESPELLRARFGPSRQTANIVDIPKTPVIQEGNKTSPSAISKPATLPLLVTPEMRQESFPVPDQPAKQESPRQPRLSPVGRIPAVISRRDRDRKLPDNSFSRPFVRAQPHPSVKPPGALYNQIRELASPIDSNSQPVSSTSARSEPSSLEQHSYLGAKPASPSTDRTSIDMQAPTHFMAFASRKNSENTHSSSSGTASWMANLEIRARQEEDLWAEYNDLLDDMMPLKTPLSAGSSFGVPFQYADALFDPTASALPTPLAHSLPPSSSLPPPPKSMTDSSVLSVPQQMARLKARDQSPSTPQTLSDVVDYYGDHSVSPATALTRGSSTPLQPLSTTARPTRMSMPTARLSTSSSRYSRASSHVRSASLPEAPVRASYASLTPSARFSRENTLLDIAEDVVDEQAVAANLRFGALMTAKWLSFDRVLFSPAHNEMRLTDDPRILILDGLGSDWSYYVALTYPSATVYNLGPVAPARTAWPGVNQEPPGNHRQIPHTGISASFPFPKGFFTAVVFRFPSAATDQAYHTCIFECKRVLRQGGYLEVMVLDLDLVNMGNKARRVVRGLKTRMQACDSDVSLRNASDSLVHLIEKRGFEEVQRCVVGVPTAGPIARSQDVSSVGSNHSGPRSKQEDATGSVLTFADLLDDPSGKSAQSGTSIGGSEMMTKMVAKIGRWWYSKCYERSLPSTDTSIWDDRTLLRECEKQGTSFRLLICHAQKPLQARRRTKSA